MSKYHIDIADNTGKVVSSTSVEADNMLEAGIIAEDILEQYHREHPSGEPELCHHSLRVEFDSMKGE